MHVLNAESIPRNGAAMLKRPRTPPHIPIAHAPFPIVPHPRMKHCKFLLESYTVYDKPPQRLTRDVRVE